MNNFEPLTLNEGIYSLFNLPYQYQGKFILNNNSIYLGNPQFPQVGDIRVSFQVVNPAAISVVAKQRGNCLESYITRNDEKIELLEIGTRSAQSMFSSAASANVQLTWILRIIGFILMWIGVVLVFGPISSLLNVLPFLGSIATAGTTIAGFGISLFFSLITVAIAWIFYRPTIAIALIGLAIFVLYFSSSLTTGKSQKINQ